MISIRELRNYDICCCDLNDEVTIITENVDGGLYMIVANSINTVLDDWNGDCDYVPENDAPVYFASYDGVVEAHVKDFGCLMDVFAYIRHEEC